MRFLLLLAFGAGHLLSAQGLFDPDLLHEVRIRCSVPAFWDSLAMDQEAFLMGQAVKYRTVDVVVDGHALPSTGMRFKGDYSYWGFPGKKRPIKLDFDRFVVDQEHDGQTKVNLHNFAGDPSFLREMLAYRMLREQGLPASRTAYAQVYVNDTLLGLYLLVEEINKRFLRDRIGHPGTLYQCIDDTELAWQGDDPAAYTDEFKIDHDLNGVGWTPLLRFIERVQHDHSPGFRDRLDELFDVASYLRAMTVDVLLDNWDSYHDNGRNFSLYHHPGDGRLYWLPWDYNLCLWARHMELPPFDRSVSGRKPLVARIADDPLLMEDLWSMACEELGRVDLRVWHDRLVAHRALIAEAVAADPHKFYSEDDFRANLHATVGVTMRRSGVLTTVYLPGVHAHLVARTATLRLEVQRHADCGRARASDLLLQVRPNPSTGPLMVRWALRGAPVPADLEVFDALGRPVLRRHYGPEQAVREEQLDLAAGHYIVRITTGGSWRAERVVVL